MRSHNPFRPFAMAALVSVLTCGPAAFAADANAPDKSKLPVLTKSGKSPGTLAGQSVTPGKATAETASLYWYDGAQKRMLATDPETIADFGSRIERKLHPELRAAPELAAKNAPAEGVSPLFIDAENGRLTGALPGGVLVRMTNPLSEDQAQTMAQSFGTELLHPIGSPAQGERGTKNARYKRWVFASQAGTATLELANLIHESGLAESASPSWWKPRTLK